MSLALDDIRTLAGNRLGVHDVACPSCGPGRIAPSNRSRRVLRIWWEEDRFARYRCARCDLQGFARHGDVSAPERPEPAPTRAHVPSEADRTDRALAIWRAARPIEGTPAERYLRRRGLDYRGEALRWHPDCPFRGDRSGALVALVRNIITNEPQAIHRTAIGPDGRKCDGLGSNGRMALGPIGGGAIKLSSDDEITLAVGIGEGIESTLSIRGLPNMSAMPVWSVLAASGIAAFPALAGVEALWIAVDHDEGGAGQAAAGAAARRWAGAGREAFLLTPTMRGADLNDLGARHGQAA